MNNLKTIIIHIGPHKTGTTTLQNALYINREFLLSNDIFIPCAGRRNIKSAAHHNLAWELLKDSAYRPEYGNWENLIREVESCQQKTIIISSEAFSWFKKQHIEKLRTKLKKFQVKIISYLRRQDIILQSSWSQTLKMGERIKFHHGFQHWLETKDYFIDKVDYENFLRLWTTIFGRENIIVRVMEHEQLRGTLFQDFISACAIPWSNSYQEPENKNISPGIKTLVLIQNLKKRLAKKEIINREVYEEIFLEICKFARKNGWDHTKVNLIDQKIHKKIMQFYKKSNQTVARDFFGREKLFLEPFQEKEITSFKEEDFRADELLDLFAFVIGKMFEGKSGIINRDKLESQYMAVKAELKAIHASRGWKWVQKLRTLRKKIRILR